MHCGNSINCKNTTFLSIYIGTRLCSLRWQAVITRIHYHVIYRLLSPYFHNDLWPSVIYIQVAFEFTMPATFWILIHADFLVIKVHIDKYLFGFNIVVFSPLLSIADSVIAQELGIAGALIF